MPRSSDSASPSPPAGAPPHAARGGRGLDAVRDDDLVAAQDRFIALWGEMAARWGVPRTMAETHALLFMVGEPLDVETIMERLRISRGNASMTLRTLDEWGIISRHLQRGERREYFRAEQDVWRLFATVARARKRRELDPLVEGLTRCRTEASGGTSPGARSAHNARVEDLLAAVTLLDGVSDRLTSADGGGLRTAAVALAKLVGFVAPKRKAARRGGAV